MLLMRLFVVGLFGFFLAACEGAGPVEAKNGTVSLNGTLTQVASLESEDDCPNGGVTLEHGIDLNGDGALEEDEITYTYVEGSYHR